MLLDITGTLDITIYDLEGNEVSEEVNNEIVLKLEKGIYSLGLASKTITDIDYNLLYNFDFIVEYNTEYDFYE